MKKLMKKKVRIFEKEISVFLIVMIAVMGITSAALVGYLGNMITGNVIASSPMEQKISDDGATWITDPLYLGTMYGGGELIFYARTENLATDKSITGTVENLVTNTEGVTCGDFESVFVRTNTNDAEYGPEYDLIAISLCYQIDPNTIQFSYGPTPTITWLAGQVDVTQMTATLKVNTIGEYIFTSQVLAP